MMNVACNSCGKSFRVAEQHKGKLIRCPGCKAAVRVPGGSAEADAGESFVVVCGGCQNRLRASLRLAGKRVDCPKCGQPVDIVRPAPERAKPRQDAAPAEGWYLHSHDGTQYGPLSKAKLDRWVADGLVSAACQIRQGSGSWRPAAECYSQLALDESMFESGQPQGGGQAATSPANYQPVLRSVGHKESVASVYINQTLPKIGRGNTITRSETFQHGEQRSFWELFKAGTVIGPLPNKKTIHIDQIHFMTISDPTGNFHVGVPFDNGKMCPIQFLSVLPGRLPTSLGLLRGAGSNEGVDMTTSPAAALFVPRVARVLARELGSQPESYWTVLDGNEPQSAAEVANQFPSLRHSLRLDGAVSMGAIERTFRIDWIAQALPLDPQQYLLVAQFIPVNKALGMLGFDLGIEWFVYWRDQFLAMANHLPQPGNNRFCAYDYGNWGPVAHEVLQLKVF